MGVLLIVEYDFEGFIVLSFCASEIWPRQCKVDSCNNVLECVMVSFSTDLCGFYCVFMRQCVSVRFYAFSGGFSAFEWGSVKCDEEYLENGPILFDETLQVCRTLRALSNDTSRTF